MDKKTGIILGVIAAAFLLIIGISLFSTERINYDQYEPVAVYDAMYENGNTADYIDGDPDAPIKIYEYGDYQCDACAPMNPYINELVEEYKGKVAVVFRTTIMSYHQNGVAAAAAANAAYRQGFWKEYKDLLFSNLNEWFYSNAQARQVQFEEYFVKASDGKGDLAKFREDMKSKDVQRKIDFDEAMAQKVGVDFTPNIYVEDKMIDQRNKTTDEFLKEIRAEIDRRLKELEDSEKAEKK